MSIHVLINCLNTAVDTRGIRKHMPIVGGQINIKYINIMASDMKRIKQISTVPDSVAN